MLVLSIRDALLQLQDSDRHQRKQAVDSLVALGGDEVVQLMLAQVCDEAAEIQWPGPISVLEGLGDRAFAGLVAVLAGDAGREVARRASLAFSDLRVTSPQRFVDTLGHHNARVRRAALHALQRLGDRAVPFAQRMVGSLTDPDEKARRAAVAAFTAMGDGAVPVLRAARIAPGPQRRTALIALAEIGAVGPRDRRLIERLIRIKSRNEAPAPMHLCGGWYALPTADQASVLDAFGLSDPFPVTMRMGGDARVSDSHYWRLPLPPHAKCARAYITPALDGWTLVFGTFLPPDHERMADDEQTHRPVCRAQSALRPRASLRRELR